LGQERNGDTKPIIDQVDVQFANSTCDGFGGGSQNNNMFFQVINQFDGSFALALQ